MTDYDYPTAFSYWGREEDSAMGRVHNRGKFTMGEECAAFEKEFAEYHGCKHAVMVNSGSSANLIAIAALFHKQDNPLKRGDKVIVPALAWSTTYSPLVQHGLELVLADCDDTWNADPRGSHLSRSLFGSRLVIGCSILGNPGHLAEWKKLADGIGAYFVEDNAESLGAQAVAIPAVQPGQRASSRGKPMKRLCGTFGLMNTFSLFYSHQISAIEGGVIVTNDDELNDLCRCLRAHGWTRDIQVPASFNDEYDFRLFGYNVRPLDLHAAIAREQLHKLEGFRRQREQNYNNFLLWAHDLPIKPARRNGIPSPFGLHFTVADTETRAHLVKALRESGIDCRLPTGGSFRLHKYGAPWRDQQTPNADHIHNTGLFLGNAPFDISDKIQKAVEVMRSVLT